MELFITSRCRAALPFQFDTHPEDMPLSVVQRSFDLCIGSAENTAVLRGNEPLLHPDIEDIFTAARKRRLPLITEVSGLMPDSARKLLIEHPCTLLWRLYRPELLTPQDQAEIRSNLQELIKAQLPIQFMLMLDDLSASYDFALDWLRDYRVRTIMFHSSCTEPLADRRRVLAWCVENGLSLLSQGHQFNFTCGTMPCLFTDADFGRLGKAGIIRDRCTPHVTVMPDGNLAHCLPMTIIPGPPVKAFKKQQDTIQYYYDALPNLQMDNSNWPECQKCVSLMTATCTGVAMAKKAKIALAQHQALKEALEKENQDQEERKQQLFEMAVTAMKISFHADAVECLEELRRHDPGDDKVHYWLGCAYWECNRLAEAEDEFRKCARLAKDPRLPLAELHRRLVKNGNTIKARLLLEEFKRIEPPTN